jgi:hypothetical protein
MAVKELAGQGPAVKIPVQGTTCASCVGRVERAIWSSRRGRRRRGRATSQRLRAVPPSAGQAMAPSGQNRTDTVTFRHQEANEVRTSQ